MSARLTRAARMATVGAVALALAGCGAGSGLVGVHDAPAQVTTTAPISSQNAGAIATRVLAKAADAKAAKPSDAGPLRAEALTGTALAVADAASRLQTPATATAARDGRLCCIELQRVYVESSSEIRVERK